MAAKNMLSVLIVGIGVAVCIPAFADDSAPPDANVIEATRNPDKGDTLRKLRTSYDFAKDITDVVSRDLYFGTGVLDQVQVAFSYTYDGQKPTRPSEVQANFLSTHGRFDRCYWRSATNKFSFSVDTLRHLGEGEDHSLVAAAASIPVETFLKWAKMPSFYMKLGDTDQLYHVDATYMSVLKELADTIPRSDKDEDKKDQGGGQDNKDKGGNAP